MRPRLWRIARLLPVLALAACTTLPSHDQQADIVAMLQRIDRAAASDNSAVRVVPLRQPGVVALQQSAREAIAQGNMEDAARLLAQALTLKPHSPPVLQAQAELALRQRHWKQAERKALESWHQGPQSGPLCARNWQTVVEVRNHANDTAGAATAAKWRDRCHIEPVHRY